MGHPDTRSSTPANRRAEPDYGDELEWALNEGRVSQMQHAPSISVSPDVPVSQVLRLMAQQGFFCVLVVDGERLIGIFSERDVLLKVADDYDAVKARPVRELMTASPPVVHSDESPTRAIDAAANTPQAHVPVLDDDGKPTGLLGPKQTTGFIRQHLH